MKVLLNRHSTEATPIAPLVVFRMIFGLVMLAGIIRFWLNGWIETLYILPKFYFPYYGFEWISPLQGQGMYVIFILMGVAAFFILIGFLYRFSALTFFLTFTYVELLDKTNYLNHYYFVSLIAFLLLFVPAGASFSVDAFLKKTSLKTVPAWCINIFKLQMGLLYFFAGIAKLNYDWLINAMPLKLWLAPHMDMFLIGPLMTLPATAYVFSWAGMLFDITIPFILLNKKTRPLGYVAVIVFHLMTSLFFQIGMFPFVMMGITLIFFSSTFHQNVINAVKRIVRIKKEAINHSLPTLSAPSLITKLNTTVLVVFFILQLLLPMRYALYPGKLFWNEEGFRFSWRVMLMEKTGFAEFFVSDEATGKSWLVSNCDYLTPQQEKMMSTQPDMILQFAHFLDHEAQKKFGMKDPKVIAEVYVSLNGNVSRPFVNSSVDLSLEKESFAHKQWVLPFEEDNKLE